MSILKPSKCDGCPFRYKGKYFTPDLVNPASKVFFLAQNPGKNEELGRKLEQRHFLGYGKFHDEYELVKPQPLIGATGKLFDNKFLPLAGLTRSEVSLGNAIRCKPGNDLGEDADWLPSLTTKMKLETSKADIVKALKHCNEAYLNIPSSVELIVTMGRYAMFALTGIQNEENEFGKKQGVMESWRGYGVDVDDYKAFKTVDTTKYHDLTSHKKILFTMHIAALFNPLQKRFYNAAMCDFHKIKKILQCTWPKPLPYWSNSPPLHWPAYSTFDTEFTRDNELTRFSLHDMQTDKLYVVEAYDVPDNFITIAPNSVVLMQNALADIGHLGNIVNFSYVKVEDLMIAHSVLWTGEPQSLNYIASKYGAFNRYKHLPENEPELYSGLDAREPSHIWKNTIIPDFKKDQLSWEVYKKYRLKLINIINKSQQRGVPINTERLTNIQQVFYNRIQEIQEYARVITGDDKFNIGGSKKVQERIYANKN